MTTATDHTKDAANAILGAVLIEPVRTLRLLSDEGAGPELFEDQHIRLAIETARKLQAAGRGADVLTVADALQGTPGPAGGWTAYFNNCLETCPIWTNAPEYLAILQDQQRRRRLVELANTIQERTENGQECGEIVAVIRLDLDTFDTATGTLAPIDAAKWAKEVLPEPEQVLNGAFDLGTKTVLVAPSKLRKSFWLLQAAVSLAGKLLKFLAWDLPKPRRVLFWNLEITPAHFHKRLLRMLRALDLTPADLGDRLLILNTRGMDATESGLPQLTEIVKKFAVDVVIVDPIYKLIPGDESKQEEIKYLLRGLDRLCTETGAAVVYSHHCGKGMAGDKQAIDRASGSGVLARDFDCQIGLTPHVEDGLMVVEQIARSYPPRDAFTIAWDDIRGCFEVADGVEPVIQTSRNRNMSGRVGPAMADGDALAVVSDKPLPSDLFKAELRRIGFTERGAREARARLLEDDKLAELQTPTFPRRIMIGTPEGIENLRQEYQNPKLAKIVS